jgi:6-phosphogluconolactonase (cycloisomerase 2 family)
MHRAESLTRIRVALAACAAAILVACGGSPGGGPTTPPFVAGPPAVSTPTDMRAFVARDSADAVDVYMPDGATGELTLQSSRALSAGSAPRHTVYDPVRRRLYIASFGTNRIDVADVATGTGALSNLRQASAMVEPVKLAIDAQARFLYVVYGDTNGSTFKGVSGFRIQANGSLVQANFLTLPYAPSGVAVDPSDQQLHVTMTWGGLQTYFINQTSGNLTADSYNPNLLSDLAFSPAGNHLYASEAGRASTVVYNIGGGGQVTSAQQFFTTSGFPSTAIAMDPLGEFLWEIDETSKAVKVLAISAVNGQLSQNATTALGSGCTPRALAVTPDGAGLHVACASGLLKGYDINATNGTLVPQAWAPTSVGARSILVVDVGP